MKKTISFIFAFVILASFATAQDADRIRQSIDRAVTYLRTTQSDLGSWHTPRTGIGPTAVVMAGLLAAGVDIDDPMIVRGLRFVEAMTNEDGGIYTPDGFLQNYETAVSIMMFVRANDAHYKKHGTKPYAQLLERAERFLRGEQFNRDRGFTPEHPFYGGAGYGRGTRPDMSNMNFFLDALKALGAEPNDPAIQSALVFVSRCQNLESPHNNMPFLALNAANNPEFLDGGFIYYTEPNPADTTRLTEGLQSYGSMTYAGLRSMIYAGLTPDDIRVEAALSWIANRYTVTENPGRGAVALFYYYMMMARTFDVMQFTLFEDAAGNKHNWRADLSEQLISVQREDGAWVNTAAQYMENDANLVTGYVLLVLALCLPEE